MADTGNVQGLVRTSKVHIFFPQILQEHEVELFFPLPCMSLQIIGKVQRAHFSVCCAAENMTSPVLFDHYIRIFYSATELRKYSQCI